MHTVGCQGLDCEQGHEGPEDGKTLHERLQSAPRTVAGDARRAGQHSQGTSGRHFQCPLAITEQGTRPSFDLTSSGHESPRSTPPLPTNNLRSGVMGVLEQV